MTEPRVGNYCYWEADYGCPAGTIRTVRTYYRSLTPDGQVWCEAASLAEVMQRSSDRPVTYQKLEIIEVTGDWRPFVPDQQEKEKT